MASDIDICLYYNYTDLYMLQEDATSYLLHLSLPNVHQSCNPETIEIVNESMVCIFTQFLQNNECN